MLLPRMLKCQISMNDWSETPRDAAWRSSAKMQRYKNAKRYR